MSSSQQQPAAHVTHAGAKAWGSAFQGRQRTQKQPQGVLSQPKLSCCGWRLRMGMV